MADYISREAAINEFCDDCMDREWCKITGYSCSRINNINAIPAADVRPAAKGKWIHKPGRDGEWICDQCSHELEFIDGRTFGMPNYCPNCGANMREVKNG